jgi:dipeptidyl aminopeptidase/acylaminoacyl peptidase
MTRSSFRAIAPLVLSTLLCGLAAAGLQAQDKPTLRADDYDQWESLGATALSPNGQWMAVSVNRVSDEGELRIHRTDADSLVIVPFGSRPSFSSDGTWVAYSIGGSPDDRDAAREEDEPVHNELGLLNLRTGEQTSRNDFESFAFSGDGRFIALRRYKPKDKESGGVDVVVHDLSTGSDMSFGNISEMAWQDDASRLALLTDADEQVGNGVILYEPSSGRIRSLDADEAIYRSLSWREDAADLVVYKTFDDEAFEDTAHVALAWRGLDDDSPDAFTLDPQADSYFPGSMRIVEYRDPSWSDDGETLFVGIQARRSASVVEEAAEDDDDDEGAPGVEVWHSRDVDPIPQQRVRETRLRQINHLSAWNMGAGSFVQLGDDLTESTEVIGGGRYVIGHDETPYEEDAMFRQQYLDLYAIEVASSEKTLIEDRVTIQFGGSPDGRYVLWFEAEDYFSYDLRSGEKHNITEGVSTTFVNLDVTPTREQMPSFGVAGWLDNDSAVLLNDQWDVWEVQLDGSGGRALTQGAVDQVRFRVSDVDPETDAFDPDEPLYYSTYSEWTKEAGYARARPGGEPEMLVWEDKAFGGRFSRLQKAEEADVFVYRKEAFDDSPDYFVAGSDLSDARQVTTTNPFQSDYAWGWTGLVDYENEWGRRLQGVLTYPAGYDPSQEYPMIVYHYELLSQGMHQYQIPDPTQYYNQQIWSQNGYFVFRPDIVYRDRRPGQSNVETLRPAVAAAVATAPIDEDKIGLIGHSWGGYQTAFFVTQDDLFTAAVAGAPLTNLMSMYLSFYWNSGGTDARIFEISQGRMQVPWWEDWGSYEANSPLHNIQNMTTPLMVEFGTNDGAVEFNQGVEFYNAARRLGKEMVLLVYDGENHGLAKEPNQLDYQNRIMQWFGHYLKGEPAPDWLSTGVPFIDQKDRLNAKRPIG